MMLVLAILGCTTGSFDIAGDLTDGGASATLSLAASPAVDPVRGPLLWTVNGVPLSPVTVSALDGDTLLWSVTDGLDASGELAGSWDATDDAGTPLDVGAIQLQVTDAQRSDEQDVAIVRTGFDTAYAEDDAGTSALREPLFWRGDLLLQDMGLPIATTDAAADFPPVGEELVFAPGTDDSEPVAYRWDSRPLLALEVPDASDLPTALDDAQVELRVEGWTAADARLLPGGTVVLQKDEALADTVGITEQDLSLSFVAVDADGAEWPLGEQLLPLRVYRVLGPQGFERTSEHYSPWPAVIDPALRAIEGTPAHHDPVVDALVEWIYTDLGLVYDTASGSSFYSEYFGWTWDEPHFYLTEFLSRQNGDIVNCSDSGNILASYSNMLGAHLKHIVILDDFNLNFIKAIGHAEHTSCPFGAPWGCGFSYHAVTTDDDGLTVWDTTLALDGDADPGSAPSTEWLVQTIPGQDYLDALVRSGSASYQYPARITIE